LQRFIVGTGRCGSTLLSKMLRANDAVTSLFEYFNGLDGARRFSREPLSGASFTEMLGAVHPFLAMVLERGYPVSEVTYPLDAPETRFGRAGGVPWILGTTIPELGVEDPDAFYDELCAFTRSLPPRPAAEQHLALFTWLTQRLGKRVWVERAGAAIDYVGELAAIFPDARFLHLHRAGEEAALSMREHHAFRLAIMLAYRLPAETGRSQAALDRFAQGEAADEIGQLLESRPPVEYFGRWWTDQVLRGFRALAGLDAHQYCEVRFEDLLARPQQVLAEIADFLALPDPHGSWRDRAAALVHGMPPSRAVELPASERKTLAQACRPGNLLLGRD